jgi:hypothetical protein
LGPGSCIGITDSSFGFGSDSDNAVRSIAGGRDFLDSSETGVTASSDPSIGANYNEAEDATSEGGDEPFFRFRRERIHPAMIAGALLAALK